MVLHTRGARGLSDKPTGACRQLLGETFQGSVTSDRWSAYNWLDPQRRQLCWAHLHPVPRAARAGRRSLRHRARRDFQKLVERGGASNALGLALPAQVEELFRLWSRVGDRTLSRAEFQAAVGPLRSQVHELLCKGATLAQMQTRHVCQNLLKLEGALWTFVALEGIEPTNNRAERCLRWAVLWRRRSFDTQSEAGSQFVARVLTAVTT
jgi:transposase